MPSLHFVRHSHPKKRRWHVIQSLFFIAVFSLAIFFFLQSPFFGVKNIEVNGNKYLTRGQVLSLTSLTKGVNIFKANLTQAQAKVATHPMVKQVDVSRRLPSTIVISITERRPIGLIPHNGHFLAVSEDGYCLQVVDNLSRMNLPIITGVTPAKVGPGQALGGDNLKDALNYLLAMPLNIRAAVSEINVADINNIRMFTIDKAEIRLGDSARINEKIQLYQEVISQKYKNKIQYIDISYKGNPVVKFIEPPGEKATGTSQKAQPQSQDNLE